MNLTGKNVLLLCPPFFGYEKEIVAKLEEMGAEVQYVEDHPSEWYITLVEVMHRIGFSRSWFIKHYEDRVLHKIGNNKFDFILIINGPYLTSRFTGLLREKHLKSDDSRIVLYYWDSLKNLNEDRKRWDDCDDILVFDDIDYQEYKERVKFLPLFYCDKYWVKQNITPEYDVMIIGSFRLNRYNYVKELKSKNPGIRIGTYLYHSKWGFKFHKTFRSKYKHVKYEDLRYKKLSFQEVVDLYSKSNTVFDNPMLGQRGLTIRTIESLAMHKKLITTNENVKKYDFYNPDDIYVLSPESMELPPKDWYYTPFSVSDKIIKEYSIESWLHKLLDYDKE